MTRRRGRVLVAVLVAIGLAGALAAGAIRFLDRQAPLTVCEISPDEIMPSQGHAYIVALEGCLAAATPRWPYRLGPVDAPGAPTASPHALLEDGVRTGPPHTQHAAIASQGGGAFSVWGQALYFSASDGTDPRSNGRRYAIEVRTEVAPGLRLLSTVLLVASSASLVLAFLWLWLTLPDRRLQRLQRGLAARTDAGALILGMGLCAAAAGLAIAAARPGSVELPIPPQAIAPSEGLALAADLVPLRLDAAAHLAPLRQPGPSNRPEAQRQSKIVLRLDGAPLPKPDAQFVEIAERGGGRFMVWGDLLAFSSPDGRDSCSGYSIEFDARPARWVAPTSAFLATLGVLLMGAATPARAWRLTVPLLSLGVAVAMVATILVRPSTAWIAGLLPPALIAVAVAVWIAGQLARVSGLWSALGGVRFAGSRLARVAAIALRRMEGSFGAICIALLVTASLLQAWAPQRDAGPPSWRLEASRGFSVFDGRAQATDALGYLGNSQWLVWTGAAQPFGVRRPVLTAWLAAVSSVTGLNLQAIVAVQAVLLALALWLFMRAMGRHLGSSMALAAGAISLGYGQQFIATTMTEGLGLPLALLGAALLLPAVRRGSGPLLAAGSFTLALALLVRPGAILVAATMPLAAAWIWRRRHGRRAITGAGLTVAGILAAMAVNAAIEGRLGRSDAASNTNAGFVLYGLSVGGDWTAGEAWLDLHAPDLGEREQAGLLVKEALRNIRSDPSVFLGSLGAGLAGFLATGQMQISAHFADRGLLPLGSSWWSSPALLVWGILGPLMLLLRLRAHPASGPLLLAAFAGVLLSAPLIWRDGLWRAFAATFPWQAMVAVFFLCPPRAPALRPEPERGAWIAAATVAVLLISCSIVLAHLPTKALDDSSPLAEKRTRVASRPLVDQAGRARPIFTAPRSLRSVRVEPTPRFQWLGPTSMTASEVRRALNDWSEVPSLQCLLPQIDPDRPSMIVQAFGVNRHWGLVGATILVPPDLVEAVDRWQEDLATLHVDWCASTLYFGEVGVLRRIEP